jgi:hypothetical protein
LTERAITEGGKIFKDIKKQFNCDESMDEIKESIDEIKESIDEIKDSHINKSLEFKKEMNIALKEENRVLAAYFSKKAVDSINSGIDEAQELASEEINNISDGTKNLDSSKKYYKRFDRARNWIYSINVKLNTPPKDKYANDPWAALKKQPMITTSHSHTVKRNATEGLSVMGFINKLFSISETPNTPPKSGTSNNTDIGQAISEAPDIKQDTSSKQGNKRAREDDNS